MKVNFAKTGTLIILCLLPFAWIECNNREVTPTGFIFVSNEDSNDISVIDIATMEVIDTISVGKRPRGMKISHDGKYLYVAVSGSPKCPPWISDEECEKKITDKSEDGIAEIDISNLQLKRVLKAGSDPEQFDISRDGNLIFVANEDIGLLSVVDVRENNVIKDIAVGREPEGVRISHNQHYVLVTNESDATVSLIEIGNFKKLADIKISNRPRDIWYTKNDKMAYVTNESDNSVSLVDLDIHKEVDKIVLPRGTMPMGLVLDEESKLLYITTGRDGKLMVINTTDHSLVKSILVGKRPWGLALSASKKFVITANGPSNDISIIDTNSLNVYKKIKVGQNPWDVVIWEKGLKRPL